MNRLILAVCVWPILVLAACSGGGDPTDGGSDTNGDHPVEYYIPASGEISGWVEDPAKCGYATSCDPGVQVADTETEATDIVDGHITIFTQDSQGNPRTWVALAMEFYKRSDDATKTIGLELYQMGSAADAQGAYEDQRFKTYAEYEEFSLGDAARIHSEPTTAAPEYYWLHARKGVYVVNMLEAKTGTDAPGKQAAVDFLTALVQKLP